MHALVFFFGFAMPVPTPAPAAASVSAVVFYDENGNGLQDPGERVRLPGVELELAGRSARTAAGTGRAVIDGVPPGDHRLAVRSDTLPPFYLAPPPVVVRVPASGDVRVPATLPIGSNRPNVYMALGDSLTEGVGSGDQTGYRGRLEALLRGHFGAAQVVDEGASATISHQGARRAGAALARQHAAFALVLYGTNDWDDSAPDPAVTINSLRRILRQVKAARSLPLLATIPPTCVGRDDRASPERNRWVARANDRVRDLAREEGAVLVDVYAALATGENSGLFADGLHPNDAGYERIAQAFFEAIAHGRVGAPAKR